MYTTIVNRIKVKIYLDESLRLLSPTVNIRFTYIGYMPC